MRSYEENIPCVCGEFYWWELGYGSGNPDLACGYIHTISGESGLFVDLQQFHDTFRVMHYPSKVIHSRKELRRWMKKKYFELTDQQLFQISKFFRENPGGVITFG